MQSKHGFYVELEDDELVIYLDGHQVAMFGENNEGKRALLWADLGEEPTHAAQIKPFWED